MLWIYALSHINVSVAPSILHRALQSIAVHVLIEFVCLYVSSEQSGNSALPTRITIPTIPVEMTFGRF